MTTINLAVPERALAVGAHPDDIEFGCGGTLAKWAKAGCEILHLVCTDGSKGSWFADEDRTALIATRQDEQRAAARRLGGSGDVVFLGWPDGELESGMEQREQIAKWIRTLKPQVILGHDPWKRHRIHPDHRHAGFLVTDGIVAARDPLFFPDMGIPPHRPETLLLFEPDEIDHVEDVSSEAEDKLAALLCHHSQLWSTMHITVEGKDPTKDALEINRYREHMMEVLSERGAHAGLAVGESFKRINDL